MSHESDLAFIRQAVTVADKAMAKGNHPFGAVLVDAEGKVIAEGENTFQTDGGPGHAETNLARWAAREHSPEYLETCTLYTSVEPCCMCAGTIYWAGIGTVVFGMTEHRLLEITNGDPENLTQDLPCTVIFDAGQRKVAVRGPLEELSDEIAVAHLGFWNNH
jgi:tRNA(Arg) A34 adenosine deaminase TadA